MKNTVILAGFVGSNPEVRTTQNGASITSLSIATTRSFKDVEGHRQTETEWHRITCFNGVGKSVAEHVTKGALVMVTGRIHYTRWTDKNGQFRYGCEIIAEQVDFLAKAKEKAAGDAELPLEETAEPAPARSTRRRSK
ncbi:single-stranded DNA-binding protein [Novosphingobium percolationis]|uniref:single-stranded DNA-binding protein n=1 Tax=Novosphingobium percolationis TaxID=2871811 RepID=UPI001CD5A37A|nr:single-stranded DNA-binding protein [Novosphingobium percolationis]